MPTHPLTNFDIRRYYQNESRFNRFFQRDDLPNQIKDGACVIDIEEYGDFGAHWIALYVLDNDAIYFDNFGVENVPKEIRRFIGNTNMQTSIFRI